MQQIFSPEEEGDMLFRNVSWHTDYTALYSRRWQHSLLPLCEPQVRLCINYLHISFYIYEIWYLISYAQLNWYDKAIVSNTTGEVGFKELQLPWKELARRKSQYRDQQRWMTLNVDLTTGRFVYEIFNALVSEPTSKHCRDQRKTWTEYERHIYVSEQNTQNEHYGNENNWPWATQCFKPGDVSTNYPRLFNALIENENETAKMFMIFIREFMCGIRKTGSFQHKST
jgi:hypothetical protein